MVHEATCTFSKHLWFTGSKESSGARISPSQTLLPMHSATLLAVGSRRLDFARCRDGKTFIHLTIRGTTFKRVFRSNDHGMVTIKGISLRHQGGIRHEANIPSLATATEAKIADFLHVTGTTSHVSGLFDFLESRLM